MLMRISIAAVLGLTALASGCKGHENASTRNGAYSSVSTRLSDSIVRLESGDSVEFQATGTASIPNSPSGMLITYHPFVDIADTARIETIALNLFRRLQPQLRDSSPPFVVLRAVDQPASVRNRIGFYQMKNFGVVLEHRADGKWYLPDAKSPVPGT